MIVLRRIWAWFDDRTGTSKLLGPILSHPVPPGAKWSYVFGSATLFAFILQVVTGIALATAYVTSSGEAYASLQFITNDPFGYLLRGVTVAMGFTGQLLRWDDIAVWSIFVAAAQASRVPFAGTSLAHVIIAGN